MSVCLVLCSERADITGSHAKSKKELQDMAEAMKVRYAGWQRAAATTAPEHQILLFCS